MAELDFTNATITDMKSRVTPFSVPPETTEGIEAAGETVITYPKFPQCNAYYKFIPHFQTPINNFVNFLIGMGYASPQNAQLESLNGIGADTFYS